MNMKILLFGATGNIGEQTLEVIKRNNLELVGISFFDNYVKAQKIINEFNLENYYSPNYKSSFSSYDELIKKTKPDIIVNAIIGTPGLEVTLLSIQNKVDIALANKESLVIAGKFITNMAKKNNVKIYPIDSEHSSLYQLIKQIGSYDELYITASGGSYYNSSEKELKKITYKSAIIHPKWKMGEKISIDSSTMINKCFELIEGYWLFDTTNIEALYHPNVKIHSVLKKGNKYYAHVSPNDMKIFIEMAIFKFNNLTKKYVKEINNFEDNNLFFIKNKKPIAWAKEIIEKGLFYKPIIINAVNDVLISLFKNNKISFDQFIPTIEHFLNKYKNINIKNINDVYKFDKLIRQDIKQEKQQ